MKNGKRRNRNQPHLKKSLLSGRLKIFKRNTKAHTENKRLRYMIPLNFKNEFINYFKHK